MATLDDIVAAAKILAEDSEKTLMSGSGSKPEEEQVKNVDVKKNGDGDDGSVASGFVRERVLEAETVAESGSDRGNGLDNDLGGREEDKNAAENVSNVSIVANGGVSVEGIERVDTSASLDGVAGRDGNVKDGDLSSRAYADGVATDDTQLDGAERNGLLDVDGKGEGEKQVQKLEDHEHEFRVGDLVWGKIRSHPWWPGQVYDPKDASDFAVKYGQEGRLLVAFFGDGSCSWCLPSQLIPFTENFVEMSNDSSSKSFRNATERALSEIGRVNELNMTCNCVPEERKGSLARPVAKNAGVRAEVFVPEVDVHRLSIPEYEPAYVFAKLVQLAKFGSFGSALELAILRSWLSSFYRFKGGHELPSYHEPIHIEGLEDKNQMVAETNNNISLPIAVPPLRPLDDDFSSPVSAGKSQASSGDKTYHRRKQKSIAELMGASNRPSVRKRKRNVDEEIDGGSIQAVASTGKRGKKRKVGVVNDASTGGRGEDAAGEDPPLKKPLEVDVAETTSGDAKEDVEIISSPRERRKSKYLSPPYTNLASRTGNSSFKTRSEIASDKIGKMVVYEPRADGEPVADTSVPESESLHDGQRKKLDDSVIVDTLTAEKEKRLTFPASDVDAPIDELFAEIQSAAVDSLYLSREGSLDTVCAFFLAHRSSTYLRGSDYTAYRRSITGKKRKSGSAQNGTVKQEKLKSHSGRTPKALKTEEKKVKSKSKKRVEVSGSKDSAKKLHGEASGRTSKSCLKVSSPVLKRAADKSEGSGPSDDLISDAKAVKKKLEIMTAILENYHSQFSVEERSGLKDGLKQLMETVETVSEKVETLSEKVRVTPETS